MISEIASDQLRAFIERIERLEQEKRCLSADIRSVYDEAKSSGFDPKPMRKIVALLRKTPEERAEEAAILETYMRALGLLADTPLGIASIVRRFGTPAPLTDKERSQGVTAAFTREDGTRMSVAAKAG